MHSFMHSDFHCRGMRLARRKIKRAMNRRFRRESKINPDAFFRKGLMYELF